MLCLDVWGDILSPPVFGAVSACGRCVAGEGDEKRDRESPVCVFITGVFALSCSLRGWLKETILARLFLGRKGPVRPIAHFAFCWEPCCDCSAFRHSCGWLHVYADHFFILVLKHLRYTNRPKENMEWYDGCFTVDLHARWNSRIQSVSQAQSIHFSPKWQILNLA